MLSSDSTALAASPRQKKAVGAALLAIAVATLAAVPYARLIIPMGPAVLPSYQICVSLFYLLTWLYLMRSFRTARMPALFYAGTLCLFTAVIVFVQLLSFPIWGSETALAPMIGGTPATTSWMWCFWHLGPPVGAILYACAGIEVWPATSWRRLLIARPLACAIALVAAAVVPLCLIATRELQFLPTIVHGQDYSDLLGSGVGMAIFAFNAFALAMLLWKSRVASWLDLFMAAAIALLLIDEVITYAGASRLSLGWYVGRLEAAIAAGLLLVLCLLDLNGRARLARAHETSLVAENDSLRRLVDSSNAALTLSQGALDDARSAAAEQGDARREALDLMASGVAHCLNNTLAAVIGNVELAAEFAGRAAPTMMTTLLADAIEAADRGAAMIGRLTQATPPDPASIRVVDVASLTAALGECEAGRRLGARLVLTTDGQVRAVKTDPQALRDVLSALLLNAEDATAGAGGRVEVDVRTASPEAILAGGMDPNGAYVQIGITDHGVGMDADTLARCMDPFFTTKGADEMAAGLGLSQARIFARQGLGSLRIESVAGAGCRAVLLLPQATAALQPRRAAPPAPDAAHEQTRPIVLIVDDETQILNVASRALKGRGYRTLVSASPSDALRIVQENDAISLVLTDYRMPEMNGLALARQIRAHRSDLPIIVMSGYADVTSLEGEPVQRAILNKPFRLATLRRTVEMALEQAA